MFLPSSDFFNISMIVENYTYKKKAVIYMYSISNIKHDVRLIPSSHFNCTRKLRLETEFKLD